MVSRLKQMYIITDKQNIIQDKASRKENLSRGKTYQNYKIHTIPNNTDCIVGDVYKDKQVTKNQTIRDKKEKDSKETQMIEKQKELTACTNLNLTDRKKKLETEIQSIKSLLG